MVWNKQWHVQRCGGYVPPNLVHQSGEKLHHWEDLTPVPPRFFPCEYWILSHQLSKWGGGGRTITQVQLFFYSPNCHPPDQLAQLAPKNNIYLLVGLYRPIPCKIKQTVISQNVYNSTSSLRPFCFFFFFQAKTYKLLSTFHLLAWGLLIRRY